jgi:hypothetical protein
MATVVPRGVREHWTRRGTDHGSEKLSYHRPTLRHDLNRVKRTDQESQRNPLGEKPGKP